MTRAMTRPPAPTSRRQGDRRGVEGTDPGDGAGSSSPHPTLSLRSLARRLSSEASILSRLNKSTCFWTTSRADADLLMELLASSGIEAFVESDDGGALYPGLSFSNGVKLVVPADQVEAAEAVLESAQGG